MASFVIFHPKMEIEIAPVIREKVPNLQLGCVQIKVTVEPSGESLLQEMDEYSRRIAAELQLEEISRLERVRSTREAYKALGKKPGRYRPSAEALLRRVVSGKGLYRINNVVDLLNLISIDTHFSIGGYDADHMEGKATLDVGQENEPYQAIARGQLNIGRLPCLRDTRGAFGTPTSDSERTRVRETTTNFLMVFFNFGGHPGLEDCCRDAQDLLERFCHGRHGKSWLVI